MGIRRMVIIGLDIENGRKSVTSRLLVGSRSKVKYKHLQSPIK